jgi:hypothetical protein
MRVTFFALAACLAATQVHGQDAVEQPREPRAPRSLPGGVAGSAVGTPGQRQTERAIGLNILPTERVRNRVANRVQNRIRNRIDRNYDPLENANAPFRVAEDEARRSRPR